MATAACMTLWTLFFQVQVCRQPLKLPRVERHLREPVAGLVLPDQEIVEREDLENQENIKQKIKNQENNEIFDPRERLGGYKN